MSVFNVIHVLPVESLEVFLHQFDAVQRTGREVALPLVLCSHACQVYLIMHHTIDRGTKRTVDKDSRCASDMFPAFLLREVLHGFNVVMRNRPKEMAGKVHRHRLRNEFLPDDDLGNDSEQFGDV